MFRTLLKIQLYRLLTGFLTKRSNNNKTAKMGKGKIVLFALLFLYVGVVFFGLFFTMFVGILAALPEDNRWFYFAAAALFSFFFMIFGSVFSAKSIIYEAKDNELLLSMPVPPAYILLSRLVSVFILEYGFAMLIIIPAFIVYALNVGFTVIGAVIYFVDFLLLGFLGLAVVCLLAYFMAEITKKAKNKSLVTTVFSLVFLGVYFYVYFNATGVITAFADNMNAVADFVGKYVFPVYHLGLSVSAGSLVSFLIFALCALVPFALVVLWLSKTFIKLTSSKAGAKHKSYVKKAMKTKSPVMALTVKEISYFFSVPSYILNCGLGLIMSVICAVFLVVKNPFGSINIGLSDDMIFVGVSALWLLFVSLSIVSSASVSLEGRMLWIAKSIPVSAKTIVFSKVYAHFIICAPLTLISSVILWIGLGMNFVFGLLMVILHLLFVLFMAFVGIMMNLRYPKFDWENEAVPVKQGASPMLTMLVGFGGFLLIGGFAIGVYMALGGVLSLLCSNLVLLILCFFMQRRLSKKAEEKFISLGC